MITNVGAFLAISALIAVAPGPDTAITTRNALVGGRRAGLFTILGVSLGLTIWTLATGIGVAALLRASEPAFVALKVVGAIYLCWLGLQAIRSALRKPSAAGGGHVLRRTIESRVAFRQGLLTNLGNPKIAVFFTSFLPQFTPAHAASFGSLVLLGVLFCLVGLTWLTIYVLAIARIGDFLRRPRPRRVLDFVTGTVLVGFGIRLATERR
ncbi:MAG TPA: LysE family translocator [Gaiellaceae bacterium]|nr:LysE family translocator [Gaiellaceae bacterium]